MRSRANSEKWTQLFLAAMGLAPMASCGGVAAPPGQDAGTGSDTGVPTVACETPVEQPGGLVSCANGITHRPRRADCPNSFVAYAAPTEAGSVTTIASDAGDDAQTAIANGSCANDGDCIEKPYGRCLQANAYLGPPVNTCEYGCVRDEDCNTPGNAETVGSSPPAAGFGMYVCLCGERIGRCAKSNCRTDDDCASGLCSPFTSACGGAPGLACRTPSDTCTDGKECSSGQTCAINAAGVRGCMPVCAIGRPFLVEGKERLARRDTTPGWAARATSPELSAFTAAERRVLCDAWTGIALMEHASIAAFARFTMQLMSVAAPAPLIESSIDAMRDETLHAKLAFGLAAAFGGSSVGPGALNIDASMEASDLASIVVTTIHEGCIGETMAAMEATAALDRAGDPVVRAVLAQVARDETRHAELAWKFVHWAIVQAGEPMRVLVRDTFAKACSAPGRHVTGDTPHAAALSRGGVLPLDVQAEVHRVALRDVIGTCAAEVCRPRRRAA